MKQKWLLLDRDGVINQDSDDYIKSESEWIPVDGSIAAICRLDKAGFKIAVVTNQSGLAREYFQLSDLTAMHNKMCKLTEDGGGKISAVHYCPHGPNDNCECRKPRTGLLDQLEAAQEIDVSGCYMVGDSLKDLQLGLAKSCLPILVRTGKGEATEASLPKAIQSQPNLAKTLVFDNLASFVDHILD